jgi:hypothetical protein
MKVATRRLGFAAAAYAAIGVGAAALAGSSTSRAGVKAGDSRRRGSANQSGGKVRVNRAARRSSTQGVTEEFTIEFPRQTSHACIL